MSPRCYTDVQVREMLQLKRSQFRTLKAQGKLPFLEELQPRIGRPRYRADLVDRYFAGQWGRPRAFGSARRSA